MNFVAEKLRRRERIQIAGWMANVSGRRFDLPRDNLNLQRTVETASRKLKSSAVDLKLPNTSRKVPGLRRISNDPFEFPADNSDFQRKGRNAADNSSQAAEKRDFQGSV